MNENYMATFEIQTGDFVSILGYDMMICIYIYIYVYIYVLPIDMELLGISLIYNHPLPSTDLCDLCDLFPW